MKSSPILRHLPNSFLDHGRQFQSCPIRWVNPSVGNTLCHLWCSKLTGGILQKLHVFYFIAMIMINVSHILCCFIDHFEEPFQKIWVLSNKDWHQRNSINQNMNEGHGLALTSIIVMKWDTHTLYRSPLVMRFIAIYHDSTPCGNYYKPVRAWIRWLHRWCCMQLVCVCVTWER